MLSLALPERLAKGLTDTVEQGDAVTEGLGEGVGKGETEEHWDALTEAVDEGLGSGLPEKEGDTEGLEVVMGEALVEMQALELAEILKDALPEGDGEELREKDALALPLEDSEDVTDTELLCEGDDEGVNGKVLGIAEKVVEWQPLALIEEEVEAEAQGLALRLAEGEGKEDSLDDPHKEGGAEALEEAMGEALVDMQALELAEILKDALPEGDGEELREKDALALPLEDSEDVTDTELLCEGEDEGVNGKVLGTAEKVVEWQPLALIEEEVEAEAQGLALRLAEGEGKEDSLDDPHKEGGAEALEEAMGEALVDMQALELAEMLKDALPEGDGEELREKDALALLLEDSEGDTDTELLCEGNREGVNGKEVGIAEKVVEWQPLALTIPLLEDDGVVLRELDALALLL
jgi:hypothetical protein